MLSGRESPEVVCQWCIINAVVFSGIPQGSVLGPIFVIIFVNDMPEIVHSFIEMFCQIKDERDYDQLQDDLKTLVEWPND